MCDIWIKSFIVAIAAASSTYLPHKSILTTKQHYSRSNWFFTPYYTQYSVKANISHDGNQIILVLKYYLLIYEIYHPLSTFQIIVVSHADVSYIHQEKQKHEFAKQMVPYHEWLIKYVFTQIKSPMAT